MPLAYIHFIMPWYMSVFALPFYYVVFELCLRLNRVQVCKFAPCGSLHLLNRGLV